MARVIKKFDPKTEFQRNLYEVVQTLAHLHGDHVFVVLGFSKGPGLKPEDYATVEHGIATNLHDQDVLSKYLAIVSDRVAKGEVGSEVFTMSKYDNLNPTPKERLN